MRVLFTSSIQDANHECENCGSENTLLFKYRAEPEDEHCAVLCSSCLEEYIEPDIIELALYESNKWVGYNDLNLEPNTK